MTARRPRWWPRLLILVIAGLLTLSTSAIAGPSIDLLRLRIDYGYAPPLDSHGYWVGEPQGGEWRVVGSRFNPGGRLTLDVEVRPPTISVPLESGPAMLFGRLALGGGYGGDVGAEVLVGRLSAQVMPACFDPSDCVYRGSITLPTHVLPALTEQHPDASWGSAVIGLSLVRTFAQGTWLQVLPMYDEEDQAPGGILGHPRTISSRMLALGAFPVADRANWSRPDRVTLARIDRLRRAIGDPSRLPDTQPLLIDIETAPCTLGWTIATVTGDTLVDVIEPGPSVPVRVEVPVDAEWTVSVPSLDRATGDPPRRFAPFKSDVPGLVSGWVSGDPYECDAVEPSSLTWRPASADDLAAFVEPTRDDIHDVYATLPLPTEGRIDPSVSPSPSTDVATMPSTPVNRSLAPPAGWHQAASSGKDALDFQDVVTFDGGYAALGWREGSRGRGQDVVAPTWRSDDGSTWHPAGPIPLTGGSRASRLGVLDDDLYALGMAGTHLAVWRLSKDGSWHRLKDRPAFSANPPGTGRRFGADIRDLALGHGRMVVSGEYWTLVADPEVEPVVWTSTDGRHWRHSPSDLPPLDNVIRDLAAAPSGFIGLVGSTNRTTPCITGAERGLTLTSIGGRSWRRATRKSFGCDVREMTYDAGSRRYYALAQAPDDEDTVAVILASDDLRTWTEVYRPPSTLDGQSWAPRGAGLDSAGGYIVVVGNASWGGDRDGGTVWAAVSADGDTWQLTADWMHGDGVRDEIEGWGMSSARVVVDSGTGVWFADLADVAPPH